MIDIINVTNDIGLADTEVARAGNILSVQLGSLEYAQDLGVDLKYFLSEQFTFQNESFKSHLIERLATWNINVSSVTQALDSLFAKYTFNIADQESNTGLVR